MLWVIFILFPLIICSYLICHSMCVYFRKKKKNNKQTFWYQTFLELITSVLEALTDPMAPRHLDSHSRCVLLQEQRVTENPELEKPDRGDFADALKQLEWPLIYC